MCVFVVKYVWKVMLVARRLTVCALYRFNDIIVLVTSETERDLIFVQLAFLLPIVAFL